jgi:hypothetical protein
VYQLNAAAATTVVDPPPYPAAFMLFRMTDFTTPFNVEETIKVLAELDTSNTVQGLNVAFGLH